MAIKKKGRKKAAKAKPAPKAKPDPKALQLVRLAKLTAFQMAGFIVLELLLWVLILANVVPPAIVVSRVGIIELSLNIGYLVVVGLVAMLVSAFWLAILVQFDIVKLEKIDFKF